MAERVPAEPDHRWRRCAADREPEGLVRDQGLDPLLGPGRDRRRRQLFRGRADACAQRRPLCHQPHRAWPWSAYIREKNIRQWAENDARVYPNYEVGIEQEPGSSGKDVAEATVRNLAGFSLFVDKVTVSKETRANPFAAMVQNSGVLLIAGSWVQEFVREAEAFPNGKYDDQIDGCSGAFNRLAQRLKFDSSFRWVDG
jgi:predicted phage terminase large subunit-like protein